MLDPAQELTIPRHTPYESGFYAMAQLWRPRRILELGTHLGRSLVQLVQGSGRVVRVVSVDSEVQIAVSQELARQALLDFGFAGELHFRVGDPGDAAIQMQIANLGPYDFINIDAEHTYAACLRDLRVVWPLLAPDGVVFVHDTEMPELWQAVCDFAAAGAHRYVVIPPTALLHGGVIFQR